MIKESKRIERLLGGLRLAIYTDLILTNRELLRHIRLVESQVELFTRETAHRYGEGNTKNGKDECRSSEVSISS